MICFVFELRLVLICWKTQNEEILRQNPQLIRRQLIVFYCRFCKFQSMTRLDFGVLVIYTFHEIILSSNVLLILLNSGLWLPQIVKSFKERSRLGPSPYFIWVLSASHIFFPLYLKGCPSNLFGKDRSYLTAIILTGLIGLQALLATQ